MILDEPHRMRRGDTAAIRFLLSGVRPNNSRMVAAVVGNLLCELSHERRGQPQIKRAIDRVLDATLRLLLAVNRQIDADDKRMLALMAVDALDERIAAEEAPPMPELEAA